MYDYLTFMTAYYESTDGFMKRSFSRKAMGQLISVKYLLIKRGENSFLVFIALFLHKLITRLLDLTNLVSHHYDDNLDTSLVKLQPIRLGRMTSLSRIGSPPSAEGIVESKHDFYNNFKRTDLKISNLENWGDVCYSLF